MRLILRAAEQEIYVVRARRLCNKLSACPDVICVAVHVRVTGGCIRASQVDVQRRRPPALFNFDNEFSWSSWPTGMIDNPVIGRLQELAEALAEFIVDLKMLTCPFHGFVGTVEISTKLRVMRWRLSRQDGCWNVVKLDM